MQVPVLIVGAGPAGLCSSIVLSRLGIRSLVVERHASTSIHPKATGISTRTMELFRAWGIEPRIRELEISARFSSSVRTDLSSPELERRSLGYPTAEEAAGFSPSSPAVLAQDVLEPILLEHARSYAGADVRFSSELAEIEQHAAGVLATVVDRLGGERTEVHARYLIAADGASSPIRRRLGIATKGVERIGQYLSVLFRADIDGIVGAERFGLYMVQALGGPAPTVVVPTSNDGRWLVAIPWRDELRPASSLTRDDLVGFVRRVAGQPDLSVTVLDHQLVDIGAAVAERFRDGNVFLVGDAAHRTAPTGGTGMNTAIQAAHNLMWKIAAVLNGTGGPDLLDTYDPERRPCGERNVLRSLGKLQGVSGVAADLGVVYTSGAVVVDGEVERPLVIEPTMPARVGSRAPHVWLEKDGKRLSTLDLSDGRLVLFTTAAGGVWRDAARAVNEQLGVALGVVTIDGTEMGDGSGRWLDACGIDADGAVLVRPDGHIAWRSIGVAADAAATIQQVVARVLGFELDARRDGALLFGDATARRCA